MTEPIVFPDTADIVIDYLKAQDGLDDLPIVSAVPNPRPGRFVVVQRLGGPRNTLVSDRAQIAVDCWSSNDVDAHDLAQLARAHLFAMYGQVTAGVQVYRVDELAGPSQLPDPDSGQHRYTFQDLVMVRGTALTTGS